MKPKRTRLTPTQKGILDFLHRMGNEGEINCGVRSFYTVPLGNTETAYANATTIDMMQILGLMSSTQSGRGLRLAGNFRLTKVGEEARKNGYHTGAGPGDGPNGEPRWMWDGPEWMPLI